MSKKLKIVIISLLLLAIIILLIYKIRQNNKIEQPNTREEINTYYDENGAIYTIVDEDTGEIIYEGTSEAAAYLYQIDPSYRPSNPNIVSDIEIFENE